MVGIQTVRTYLAGLQQQLKTDLVAVFVGGTSGIGESTAREVVRYTGSPTVYIVGRSQTEADRITAEFKELNSKSKVHFIRSDVSLLRNVDKVCDEIKSKEKKINLLVLTPGILTLQGRTETTEGLDNKMALHYYTRMRFTYNLLPLLNNAAVPDASNPSPIARVISVLAAGHEAPIDVNDLSLKKTFSIGNAANHATTMNSLALSWLAKENPSVSFIHSQPGGVNTNLARNFGTLTQYALGALMFVAKPFLTDIRESGERHAWAGTNEEFKTGAHYLNPSSEPSCNTKLMEKYENDGTAKKVEEHTKEMFESICNDDKTV